MSKMTPPSHQVFFIGKRELVPQAKKANLDFFFLHFVAINKLTPNNLKKTSLALSV